MKLRTLIPVLVLLFSPLLLPAQTKADSLKLANTLKDLLNICRTVNVTDPKTKEPGSFYKAAPYMVYRGTDKARAWKSFADYSKQEDKKAVDETCMRINETVNRDLKFRITGYSTEKESEGTWHVLKVTYYDFKSKTFKKAAFAFLKIGDRFGLGDID